ncbi:MAG: hypothetical protein R3E79_02840 [Caldilineaceae bacterium]
MAWTAPTPPNALLQDSTDLLDLQTSPPPNGRAVRRRYHEVLEDFLQKQERQGPRLLSTSFVLPAQFIALAGASPANEPLRMPVPTAHGVEATQLFIRCRQIV